MLIERLANAVTEAAEKRRQLDFLWIWAGRLYTTLERNRKALYCWAKAASSCPENFRPRLEAALILHRLGRLAEAEEQFHRAIDCYPTNYEAHFRFAQFYESCGEKESAVVFFNKAAKCQPSQISPRIHLANLVRSKLAAEHRTALELAVEQSTTNIFIKARALFSLAKVYDDESDYGKAAESLQTAHALERQQAISKRTVYSSTDHEGFIDRTIQAFEPSLFNELKASGVDSNKPVFVFGLPRTGTTLVEQMLASHPSVSAGGELFLARQSFLDISRQPQRRKLQGAHGLHIEPDRLRDAANHHLAHLINLAGNDAKRIVDKMPGNYAYLGLLAAMFPNATFVHCVRDLRDVGLSCWSTDFREVPWTNSVIDLKSHFTQYIRVMRHWGDVLPVAIHEVRYEQLVSDFDCVARHLLAACNLAWDDKCLTYFENRRLIRTASAFQVRTPIYSNSIGHWKNYEPYIHELFRGLPFDIQPQGN